MIIDIAAAFVFRVVACSSATAQTQAIKVGVEIAASAALVGTLAPALLATGAQPEPELLAADLTGLARRAGDPDISFKN